MRKELRDPRRWSTQGAERKTWCMSPRTCFWKRLMWLSLCLNHLPPYKVKGERNAPHWEDGWGREKQSQSHMHTRRHTYMCWHTHTRWHTHTCWHTHMRRHTYTCTCTHSASSCSSVLKKNHPEIVFFSENMPSYLLRKQQTLKWTTASGEIGKGTITEIFICKGEMVPASY